MRITLALTTCLLAGFPVAAGLAAQTLEERPQIAISGQAVVEAEPDQAILHLAVETFAESARDAARENAERMDQLVRELRRQGLGDDQIRTVSYSLQPEYRRPDPREPQPREEPRIVGYRAVNVVRVVIDSIPRVGPIIDAAIERGGNRVAGLAFQLRDPEPVRREALRRATRVARAEAQVLADALGVELGGPLRVSSSAGMPVPRGGAEIAMQRQDMAAAPPPPTPVEPGLIDVRADVHIIFEILRR